MSVEQIQQAETNHEAMLFATADAAQAARIVSLWACPTIPDQHIPEALGIPPSLWAEQKRQGDTPPLFLIGRRLFCRTSDLRKWLDGKADAGRPGSKKMRARTVAA